MSSHQNKVEELVLGHEWLVRRITRKVAIKYSLRQFEHTEDLESEVRCAMLAAAVEYCESGSQVSFCLYSSRACMRIATRYAKRVRRQSALLSLSSAGFGAIARTPVDVDDVLDGQQVWTWAEKYLQRRTFKALWMKLHLDLTLMEIGEQICLSQERVRQILVRAISKLKNDLVAEISE